MTLLSIFELCKPRDDVAKGTISDSDYAANLANVLTGRASRDYTDAPTFFTNTYPTEGLKELLANVCGRLSGRGESVSAVFRLDTQTGETAIYREGFLPNDSRQFRYNYWQPIDDRWIVHDTVEEARQAQSAPR